MKKIFLRTLKFFLEPKRRYLPDETDLIKHLEGNTKILIIRQHNQLGDMLLSNSLFRAIKVKIPNSSITLLASEENYQAVISNKYIDNTVVLKKKELWNPFFVMKFFNDLRKLKYDLAIVPVTVSISFTSCLIARLSGAKFKIGPASLDDKPNKYSFLFDYKIEVGKDNQLKRHISDKILDIVRPFGIDTNDLSEHILILEDDRKFAEDYFKDVLNLKVGFHIGAGKIPNRWSIRNFAELINYFYKKYNAFVYLTIGNWDEELLDQIIPMLDRTPNVLRNLSIPKLAAIIGQSDLFISNDTGIMHVAGSTETPLVALFGPTDPEIWAPIGKNKFFIKKGNDINSIDVKDVIEVINNFMIEIIKSKMHYKRIAAIDLGTNSFHLVIVELKDLDKVKSIEEIESKSNFEVLYRQREVVRINVGNNQETNLLTAEGVDRAIKVLKVFKQKIDEYGAITHAIATSAIRDAENRSEFLEYVRENLGIEIKVISGYEEARLIYLGVLQGLNVYEKQILLIDIGGGSTELLIGKRGKILYALSFNLGAVRLTQKFFNGGKSFPKDKKYECEKFIKDTIAKNLKPIKEIGFEQVVGTSGEIQAIARLLFLEGKEKSEYKTFHDIDFSYDQFDRVAKNILKSETLEELKRIENLDERRAEIIIPGTLILKFILEKLQIDKVTVSNFALREGIIIDAIEKIYKKEPSLDLIPNKYDLRRNERVKNVIEFAKSFDIDLKHSNQVRKIALKIFDELIQIHKLDDYARELLEYAAILHDIGYHISQKKHHKHSYYIIKNSNLVGFSENEIDLIANIARYHRKALPKEDHKNLKHFSDKEKKLINSLSAILRLSDGLEKTHNALINDIKIIHDGRKNSFIMVLRYLTYPPESELWAAEKRKSVIEELFDIKVSLRLEKISY